VTAVPFDPVVDEAPVEVDRHRRLRVFVRNKGAVVAATFLVLLVLSAIFAPLLAPYDPTEPDFLHLFATPGTGGHLLGTDALGRDILSRLLYASRISLLTGAGSVLVSLVVAVPLGLVAGYVGGKVDAVVMWIVNVILSIPPLILVFAVAGVLGASLTNVIVALGVYFTPLFVRLVRGEVLRLRTSQLVEAEIGVGASHAYVMRRHILPSLASPLVVQGSLSIGVAILAEASLSFLGVGVRPPKSSWGIMINVAFSNLQDHAWLIFIPGATIGLTVLAVNLVGDGLLDALGRAE
jgi:ABC-type dipeptide/oligopeptide/nickel transport system permease subunit